MDVKVQCNICYDVLKNNSSRKVCCTSCGHGPYHWSCLKNWMETDRSCPVCRRAIDKKQIIRLYLLLDLVSLGSSRNSVETHTLLDSLCEEQARKEMALKQLVQDNEKFSEENTNLRENVWYLNKKIAYTKSDAVTLQNNNDILKQKNGALSGMLEARDRRIKLLESSLKSRDKELSHYKSCQGAQKEETLSDTSDLSRKKLEAKGSNKNQQESQKRPSDKKSHDKMRCAVS